MTEGRSPRRGASEGEAERKYAPECYACPIGSVSMAVQKTAPEATEHLLRAGRELLLALKGAIEGVSDVLAMMEQRSEAARRQGPVETIPIRRRH